MHTFSKFDLPVNKQFLEKFANRYVSERSVRVTDGIPADSSSLFNITGFDTTELEKVITRHLIAIDNAREKQLTAPETINDIYRSDLGELLMTYYFEEKVNQDVRFTIPIKNISYRELATQPGRGLDAIGYRFDGNRIYLLFGEAKVSAETKSPPQVVHTAKDSIYKTQLKYKKDKKVTLDRLSDYYKRISDVHATVIGAAIVALEKGLNDKVLFTYGCVLIRDMNCVNENGDPGMLKSKCDSFNPDYVHFSILSFDKPIEETVQLFYEKVQELIAA